MNKTRIMMTSFATGIVMTLMFGASYLPAGAGERNLAFGKIGGDVAVLQKELKTEGYKIDVNGMYGLKTRQAVIAMQKKKNLKATGVFDMNTKEAFLGVSKDGRDKNVRTASREGTKVVSRGVSREDVMLLARTIHGEARGESFKGKVAVAAVIINRTQSDLFPNTIKGVIFQPGAFDAVADGQIWLDPDAESIKAAEQALSGYDPTGDSIYYWNPAKTTNKWIWSRPVVTQIGQHLFAK